MHRRKNNWKVGRALRIFLEEKRIPFGYHLVVCFRYISRWINKKIRGVAFTTYRCQMGIERPWFKILLNTLCNTFVMRRDNLCTIAPIHFVSIVLFWIMRCCNHDTTHGLSLQHTKRHKWCGHKTSKQIHFKSFRQKYCSSNMCKFKTIMTSIITNTNGKCCFLFFQFVINLFQICTQSLTCLKYCKSIHKSKPSFHFSS
mmetsp:Transcript_4692/g.7050  ORF Transcript_4692/g.7050 Transcript_4692/m.7050 type:complete len:200 (-) Transcript_4692:1057-1656(-)